MQSPKRFGCLNCGKEFEVRSPDDIYTEANRKYKKASYDDMLPMTKECLWCKEKNEIYWYKPNSN
ncbi:MAG: hypothetical protein L0H55_16295 [Candidatus Nitrosocosmicus sp.]|nr:hypothetical protein [Candidatus Nitrosocosmicus sp.]